MKYEDFLNDLLRRTKRRVKLLELGAGAVTFLAAFLGFLTLGIVLDHALALPPLARWTVPALLSGGLAVVLVFSLLRLRYTWWPIHPIIFCVWGTQSMKALSASFLLGWIIKGTLSRLGLLTSGRIARVRALMVGMIAGDLLAGVVFMIAGAVYYAVTRLTPPAYYIFPH